MTWETVRNLVRDEWVILSLLFLWSLAGLTIICERIYALWNVLPKSDAFRSKVIAALDGGDLAKAAALCETSSAPLAEIYERGLVVFQRTPHKTAEAVASQRAAVVLSFKRYLWALGTVGSSAPFVGLFGTVVGILKAFQSMSVAGSGGFKVVSQGIAAALVATAAGLLVAIYAVIAYNYFVSKVNGLAMQYKLYTEEFLLSLGEYARTRGVGGMVGTNGGGGGLAGPGAPSAAGGSAGSGSGANTESSTAAVTASGTTPTGGPRS